MRTFYPHIKERKVCKMRTKRVKLRERKRVKINLCRKSLFSMSHIVMICKSAKKNQQKKNYLLTLDRPCDYQEDYVLILYE